MQQLIKNFFIFVLCIAPIASIEAGGRPIVLLLLGVPGSGRDALAVKISSSFSLPYISTADLLLDYSDDDSEIGHFTRECLNTGRIPDDLLMKLILERIKQQDCAKGFLLDGFPKTVEQAKALNVRFSQEYCMLPTYIRTSDQWLLCCHEGRLICTSCGRVYHQDRSPPHTEGECDLCGYELTQRSDDCPETLKKRTETHRDTILPLVSFYTEEKMLVEINGDRPFDEMFQDVKMLINSKR
ncbi:MAG: nucleoside monophosphate kinase [Verrucomicrobia bacterium]|nr:nucleoside monophosphate kinase [Verrucomicrobiota bacterium]MBS0637427.1 nucleoside monophosphate kinase [Verrucomicrobiota bacterium]